MKIFLNILMGPFKGESFLIKGGETIGRESGDIVLNDPKISSKHAVIKRTLMGKLIMIDQKSKNGIKINGKRVEKVTLEPGAKFQVGSNYFVVSDKPPANPSTPMPKPVPQPKATKLSDDDSLGGSSLPSIHLPESSEPKTAPPKTDLSQLKNLTPMDLPKTGLSSNPAVRAIAEKFRKPQDSQGDEKFKDSNTDISLESDPLISKNQDTSAPPTQVRVVEPKDLTSATQTKPNFNKSSTGIPSFQDHDSLEDDFRTEVISPEQLDTSDIRIRPAQVDRDYSDPASEAEGLEIDEDLTPEDDHSLLDPLQDDGSQAQEASGGEKKSETRNQRNNPVSAADMENLIGDESQLSFANEPTLHSRLDKDLDDDELELPHLTNTITTARMEAGIGDPEPTPEPQDPEHIDPHDKHPHEEHVSTRISVVLPDLEAQNSEASNENDDSEEILDAPTDGNMELDRLKREASGSDIKIPTDVKTDSIFTDEPETKSQNSPSISLRTLAEKKREETQSPYKDSKKRWNSILADFSRDHIREVRSKPVQMVPFAKGLKLTFFRGIQAETEWHLGYGPRFIGKESSDLPLFDEGAPGPISFSLHPNESDTLLKTDFPNDVKVNGVSREEHKVKNGDIITIHQTEIEVEIL